MKLYSCYAKIKCNKVEDIFLIKEGFIFSAFLFNILWLIYYKMWKIFFIICVVNIFFLKLFEFNIINTAQFFTLLFCCSILIGVNANDFYNSFIKKKGYEFKGFVFGNDKSHAEYILLSQIIKK